MGDAGQGPDGFAGRNATVHVLRSAQRFITKQADEGADRRLQAVDLGQGPFDCRDAADPSGRDGIAQFNRCQVFQHHDRG